MADTRTVELEIRAQDLSGKTISDIRKNIRGLKDDLEAQKRAASKGKADFKQYEQGLKGLSDAAERLNGLQNIASKLERLGKEAALQADKARKAATAHKDLTDIINKAGGATKEQAEQLARLDKAQQKAAQTAKKHADAYERQRIEAEAYGLKTNDIKRTQDELNKTYQRTLQRIIDLRNEQAALQRINERVARTESAKAATAAQAAAAQAAAQEQIRQRVLANIEASRKAREEADKARKEAARAAHERRVAAQQAAAEAAKAIQLAQQQAAAEAAKQRAAQAALNAQRNQINASRLTIQQQLADAQRQAALQRNRATDAVTNRINPTRNLDGSMGNISASVRNAQNVMRNNQATAEQVTAALKRLKQAQEQMLAVAGKIDAYRRQQVELSRLAAEYRRLQSEYARLNSAMRNGNATSEQITRLRQLAAQLNQAGAAYARQRVSVGELSATLQRAGVNLNNLGQAEQRLQANASRSAAAMNRLSSSLGNVSRGASRSADELRRLSNSSRTALGFMQRLRGQLLALAGAYAGVNGAIALFNKTLNAGQEGMVLKIRTEVLADNWQGAVAKDLEEYFRGTAERMGLELSDVIQDASKLFVAAKENGYNLNEAKFVYEQFSGLGQLMGADAETQKGITKALSDMFSKGTIQAEELKGQLGDRLPQAMALFAKATGKSNAELMKMMKNGELTSDYIIKAAGTIKSQYGDQMEKMYHTINAEQARMNNAFKDWLRIIADAGVMENFKTLLVEITNFFRSEEGRQWAENIAAALNKVVDVLRWCVKHTNELAIAFGALLTIGAGQMLTSLVLSLSLLGRNLALVGTTIVSFAKHIGLITAASTAASAQVATLSRAMSMNLRAGNYFKALSAGAGILLKSLSGLLGIVGRVFKGFIVFQLIGAVFKGIVRGIEQVTGKSLEAGSALSTLSDIAWVIGQAFDTVATIIGGVLDVVTSAVATVVSGILSLFVDTENQATKSAQGIDNAMSTSAANSESSWTSGIRKMAAGFDALKWAGKSAALYVSRWLDWVGKKLRRQEAEMPDWGKTAEEVAAEISENGSVAAFNKRLQERQQEILAAKRPYANATNQPAERAMQAANNAEKEAAKRAKAAQDADAKIQAAREKAEKARQRAEEAALKRLEKELSYEKMLQKLVDYRKGKLKDNPMAGHKSLGDWYLSEYEKVSRKYAAGADPYANYKPAEAEQNEAAQTQVKAAEMQLEAAQAQKTNVGVKSHGASVVANVVNGASKPAKPVAKSVGASLVANSLKKTDAGSSASSYAVDNRAARAADIATRRAAAHFTKQCATYVKQALAQADSAAAPYIRGGGKDTAKNLLRYGRGWQQVTADANYVPRKGDVVSWGAIAGHKWGHTALYNGSEWVSDTRQGKYDIDNQFGASSHAYLAEMRRNPNYRPTIVRLTGGNSVTITGNSAPKGKAGGLSAKDQSVVDYYKAQQKKWGGVKDDERAEQAREAAREHAEEINTKVADAVHDALSEMYKTMGVNGVEGLINRDADKLTLDLSGSSLSEIIDGFKDVMQPETDGKVEQLLELLTLDYQNKTGKSNEEALAWSRKLEPQIKRYAELQAQRGMREHVDAFVGALEEERSRIGKEREDTASFLGSAVARGAMSIEDAQKLIADSSKSYSDKMESAIKKLDETINSEGFKQLSPEQQASIRNQREQLASARENPDNNPATQSANAAVDAMTARLDGLLSRKTQFEAMQKAMVENGSQSIQQMEQNVADYLARIRPQMLEAVQQAQQMMQALGDTAASENLANLASKIREMNVEGQRSNLQIQYQNTLYEQLNQGAMTAFQGIAQGLAGMVTGQMSAKEALANLGQAFAQWASDALMNLAKVIMQQYISLALQQALSGMGGGFSIPNLGAVGNAATGIGALFHTGGIVGAGKHTSKPVNPLVFVGATRYHTGGIAGLAPNEVPAVLQRGEEVLTKNDPRHRDNQSQNGNTGSNSLTVINSFNPTEAMRQALKSSEGRKILVNAAGRERKAFGRL